MSKKVVAIVDYGLGNLFSINQACGHVGLDPVITADKKIIAGADALILPGVGAFGHAMNSLQSDGLIESLLDFAKTGKQFLGICLGMQLLFSESEEFGANKGLGLVDGRIVRFPSKDNHGQFNRVPQIQWNHIYKGYPGNWERSLFKNTNDGEYMYFVHSYYSQPVNDKEILTYSEYGGVKYASAVIKDNITGIQYHPEKSAEPGLNVYATWSGLI
jgi:glutamine amidotransferase